MQYYIIFYILNTTTETSQDYNILETQIHFFRITFEYKIKNIKKSYLNTIIEIFFKRILNSTEKKSIKIKNNFIRMLTDMA